VRTPRATLLGLAVTACGGPAHQGSLDPAARRVSLDLSATLPASAPLRVAFVPSAWRVATDELSARAVAVVEAFRRSDAGFTLDPDLWPALGIDERSPAWFSVDGGDASALFETADDLGRVLMAPDALPRWRAETLVPPAWLHLRLAGAPTSTSPGDATTLWLSQRFGALQSVGIDEGAEALGLALECAPEEAAHLHAALAARGPTRVHRLLDASPAVVVVVTRAPDRVIVDLVQDRVLGPRALTAGLRAALAPTETPPRSGRLGLPGPGEVLRATLDHRGFARWARVMADAQVLGDTLALEGVAVEALATSLAQGRAQAAAPERLQAAGQDLFGESLLRIRSTGDGATGGSLLVDIEARYADRGRRLAELGRGVAALPHRLLSPSTSVQVTLATPGAAALGALDAVAPRPERGLDLHLNEVARCGFVCWPSLWTSIPTYARAPLESLGAVLPEVALLAPALTGAQGVSATWVPIPQPGFALSLRPGDASGASARPLPEGLSRRSVAAVDGPAVLISNDDTQLVALERAQSLSEAGARATPSLLELSLEGPLASVFKSADVRLGFEAEAMRLSGSLAWLPLAPPPAPEGRTQSP